MASRSTRWRRSVVALHSKPNRVFTPRQYHAREPHPEALTRVVRVVKMSRMRMDHSHLLLVLVVTTGCAASTAPSTAPPTSAVDARSGNTRAERVADPARETTPPAEESGQAEAPSTQTAPPRSSGDGPPKEIGCRDPKACETGSCTRRGEGPPGCESGTCCETDPCANLCRHAADCPRCRPRCVAVRDQGWSECRAPRLRSGAAPCTKDADCILVRGSACSKCGACPGPRRATLKAPRERREAKCRAARERERRLRSQSRSRRARPVEPRPHCGRCPEAPAGYYPSKAICVQSVCVPHGGGWRARTKRRR